MWRAGRLIVELDGHASHGTRAGFERDRERGRILVAAGWRVVRITWRQLHDEPELVAADLRALLRQGRAAAEKRRSPARPSSRASAGTAASRGEHLEAGAEQRLVPAS